MWNSETRRILLRLKILGVLVSMYASSLSFGKCLRLSAHEDTWLRVALTIPILLPAGHKPRAVAVHQRPLLFFLSCPRAVLPDMSTLTYIFFSFSLLLLLWKIFLKKELQQSEKYKQVAGQLSCRVSVSPTHLSLHTRQLRRVSLTPQHRAIPFCPLLPIM